MLGLKNQPGLLKPESFWGFTPGRLGTKHEDQKLNVLLVAQNSNPRVLSFPRLVSTIINDVYQYQNASLEDGYKGDVVQIKTESYKLFPEIPVVKGSQW